VAERKRVGKRAIWCGVEPPVKVFRTETGTERIQRKPVDGMIMELCNSVRGKLGRKV
jgi:hypothetical protein